MASTKQRIETLKGWLKSIGRIQETKNKPKYNKKRNRR